MRIKKIIYLSFLLLLTDTAISQSVDKFILSEVKFEGLDKTDELVVRRMLHIDSGHILNLRDIEDDAQYIRNLPGIGDVKYKIDTIDQQIKVEYQIDEIKTLLPILSFGGIDGNVWYQLGFTDINWLGKGNQFSAFYQNSDRRHSGSIYYKMPRIKLSNWGYSVSLSRWASQEPLFFPNDVTVQYNFDFNSIGFTGSYQFDSKRTIEFGGSYFVEKYTKLGGENGEILPGPIELTQPKLLTRMSFEEIDVNYHFHELNGYSYNISYQNVITINDPVAFRSIILQSKYYKRLPNKINLAVRLRFGMSSNSDSPFAPFVVDSHVNLRGVGNRIDRGTAQIILNAELRKTIHDKKKWASQVVAFTDIGSWRNPGGRLTDLFGTKTLRQFIGGGIRIIYQRVYGAVLRIDYGVDLYNPIENGVVIGFGQYF